MKRFIVAILLAASNAAFAVPNGGQDVCNFNSANYNATLCGGGSSASTGDITNTNTATGGAATSTNVNNNTNSATGGTANSVNTNRNDNTNANVNANSNTNKNQQGQQQGQLQGQQQGQTANGGTGIGIGLGGNSAAFAGSNATGGAGGKGGAGGAGGSATGGSSDSHNSTTALGGNSASAVSGSGNGGISNVAVTEETKEAAHSASATPTTVVQSDSCAIGFAAGGQAVAFGFSISGTKIDENCERIKLWRELRGAGYGDEAKELLMQDERVAKAFAAVTARKTGKVALAKPTEVVYLRRE